MIIRLSVSDNDFNSLMSSFVHNLTSLICQKPSNIKELDIDKRLEILDELDMIYRLLNPNITWQHTDEEKQLLIKKIKETFSEYVKDYFYKDKEIADYLIQNFKVEIINSMEDKWENGDTWYWFQHSRMYFNQ